jgi:hypothetical protein
MGAERKNLNRRVYSNQPGSCPKDNEKTGDVFRFFGRQATPSGQYHAMSDATSLETSLIQSFWRISGSGEGEAYSVGATGPLPRSASRSGF